MRNKELRIEDDEVLHKLGGAGEGGTQGLKKFRKTNQSFCALKCQRRPCLNLMGLSLASGLSFYCCDLTTCTTVSAHVTLADKNCKMTFLPGKLGRKLGYGHTVTHNVRCSEMHICSREDAFFLSAIL